jgi:hypothetical protein
MNLPSRVYFAPSSTYRFLNNKNRSPCLLLVRRRWTLHARQFIRFHLSANSSTPPRSTSSLYLVSCAATVQGPGWNKRTLRYFVFFNISLKLFLILWALDTIECN